MISTRILGFLAAFAAAVSAAPVVNELAADVVDYNVTDSGDRDLRNGEMLVYGLDGRTQIITEKTWGLFLQTVNVEPDAPEIDYDWLKSGDDLYELSVDDIEAAPGNVSDAALSKRDCNSNFQYVIDKTQRFVDWDVQMSPVIIGAGNGGIDVTISKSYAIANSVSVSAGIDLTLIKDRLKAGLNIDYSRTWTTTQGYLVRGNVAAGQTGVVITRPWTNRRYGRTFQGCVGSLRQTGTFMANSHEDGSYEGVTWVAGAITMCTKKQSSIPLSRCNGGGNFN